MKTIFMTGIHNNQRRGFTLIETITAIGIFMILIAVAVGGFVRVLHTQSEVNSLISSQSNISLAVEQMTREIRTGYLFCHNEGDNVLSQDNNPCGCTDLGPSGWSCSSLDYYNSASEHVHYDLENGALTRTDPSENNGNPQPLTSGDVAVRYFSVLLFGNKEGDGWPPRVSVMIGIGPNSTDPAIASTTLKFETTASARQIDCNPTTNQC